MKKIRKTDYKTISSALTTKGIHGEDHEELAEEITMGAVLLYQTYDGSFILFNTVEGKWVTFEDYKTEITEANILFSKFNDPDNDEVRRCDTCFGLFYLGEKCKDCTKNKGVQ